MAELRAFRETTLPASGSRLPRSLYFVAPAGSTTYMELYSTGATANDIRRIITEQDVNNLIASIAGEGVTIVADIAARNALTPDANIQVFVIDASGDATVTSGGATYLYNTNDSSWIKISEAESMDLVLEWANIQNKPTSSVGDIDDAVALRHTHTNKTELDKVGEDGSGNFTYDGALPVIAWNSVGW